MKIAQFGLGPIGLETLKLCATKPWAKIVAAIDIDPNKVGRDLGELTGSPSLRGIKVCRSISELPARQRPNLVLHTAVSKFEDAFAQIEPLPRLGIDVVSSCEELVFPQLLQPKLAARLDRLCKAKGARVVGTGVNPGFVMDLLPVCMTAVSCSVKAVHVERVVNASTRRGPLQRKIGSGMNPAEFTRLLRAGKMGHAGLKQSAALLCHCLGWDFSRITETGEAVVADHDIETPHVSVRKGQTCGLHQRAEVKVGGELRVTLDIQMYLDAPEPRDAIRIEGEPSLNLVIAGGVAGDKATVATLVNTAANLSGARAGLLLPTDLPVPHHS